MKAGFIGLGALGKTMAQQLISEGVELTVWNRTISKAEGLKAEIAKSPVDVFRNSDVIILNLFDSEAVNAIMTGTGGFIECEGDAPKLVIDTTTNHYSSAKFFHELMSQYGASYLEAPVLGSIMPASKGLLTVLAGGPKPAFEVAKPFLEVIGKKIFHFESPGVASKMKLINNLLLGTFMSGIAEALVLAEEVGLDKTEALDVFDNGGGKSLVLDAKKQKLIDEDFSPHFTNALIYKDLHCLQDLARDLGRPLFTASMAKEIFGMTLGSELKDKDFSSVYEVFKSFGKKC